VTASATSSQSTGPVVPTVGGPEAARPGKVGHGRGRGRRFGLRSRAVAAFGALSLGVSAVLGIVTYELARNYLLNQRLAAASRQAYLSARAVKTALRAADPNIPDVLRTLSADTSSVLVVQVGGRSFSTSLAVSPRTLPASLVAAVNGGSAARQLVRLGGRPRLVVGVPIAAEKAAYFELVSFDELDRTLAALARALAVGAAIATAAGSALGLYASRRVLRPLGQVAETAAGITAGNLHARLAGVTDPDLGPLVDAFNAMVDALEGRIQRETRFASEASHDLRAPLAAMASAISVARRHVGDPSAVAGALDVLTEKVDSFQMLVRDLLDIGRAEAGYAPLELEEVRPAAVAQDAAVTPSGRRVPVELDSDSPERAWLDRRRVSQILANLIENAERYGGGTTRLTVSGRPGTVRFGVEDAGPGVPDQERQVIFERFARGELARLTAPNAGTGLGLAIVAEHARLHGGTAWVEDSDVGGARFVVELPADQQ
jgi:two-component system, OmpR family, sensor histidine kinase MtrB